MRQRYKLYNITDNVIRVLYPAQCPVCGDKGPYKEGKIHIKCRDELPYINGARCRKCSKEILDRRAEYCYDCQKSRHLYREGVALFAHKGKIKNAVYAIKYDNKREYLDFFADELIKEEREKIGRWNADMLVPVPLYKRKEIKRGFNQADEFAKRIGRRMNIKVESNAIERVRQTTPQKELSDVQRRKNLEKAFKVNKNIVKSKKIIIVDDIYTTGSTIDACSEVLLRGGADAVYFITMSIGNGL